MSELSPDQILLFVGAITTGLLFPAYLFLNALLGNEAPEIKERLLHSSGLWLATLPLAMFWANLFGLQITLTGWVILIVVALSKGLSTNLLVQIGKSS